MKQFVLDASVALSWFFEDEGGTYSAAVLDNLIDGEPQVPSLWLLEVTNALVVAERRRRCNEAEARRFIGLLESLSVVVHDHTTQRSVDGIYQLAREYSLSAYDAVYLELAMRMGVPLATMDRQLTDAAQRAGVTIFLQ